MGRSKKAKLSLRVAAMLLVRNSIKMPIIVTMKKMQATGGAIAKVEELEKRLYLGILTSHATKKMRKHEGLMMTICWA